MKIREILAVKGAHVHTIDPDRTLLDAVALLVQHGIGALLVRDGERRRRRHHQRARRAARLP